MATLESELIKLVTEKLPAWLDEEPELRRRLQEALQSRVTPRRMTYQEFLAWADEDTLAEWVDGGVVMYSPASKQHQDIASFLSELLRFYVQLRDLGEVIQAPFQMKLEHGREPDLLFVAREHLDRLKETYLDGPADLVVEIISEESIARDRGAKFYEYEQAGIPEYWLLDPEREQAEFYQLSAQKRYRMIAPDAAGVYRSVVLPGFWLKVDWLWQEPLPHPLRVLGEIAGADAQLVERFLDALRGN